MAEPLFGADFARKLERLAWVLRRRGAGGGEGDSAGRRKGGLIEFADHRDYAPGDDPRAIDWNAYARLDRLTIKEFSKEEEVPLLLLVDVSASMGAAGPEKFALAMRSAAALGYVSLASGNPVVARCFGNGDRKSTRELRGKGALGDLTAFLSAFIPSGATGLDRVLAEAASEWRRGGLIVVVSDLMDEGLEPKRLSGLASRGRDVCVLQVLARSEASPAVLGPVSIVDSETGESLDLDLRDEDLAAFGKAMEESEQEFARAAESRGVRFVSVRADVPFEEAVVRVLSDADWLRLKS